MAKAYRKAGVVVGITFAVAAALVWGIGSRAMEPEPVRPSTEITRSAAAAETAPSSSTPKAANTAEVEGKRPKVEPEKQPERVKETTPEPAKPADTGDLGSVQADTSKGTTGVQVFEEGELGEPSKPTTIPMVVTGKTVTLIDMAKGSTSGKQLVYTVSVISGKSTTLTLYLNGSAYESLAVGDKLTVTYRVYTNTAGIRFPVVEKAVKVE